MQPSVLPTSTPTPAPTPTPISQPPVAPQPVTPTNYQAPAPTIALDELAKAKAMLDTVTKTFDARVVGQHDLRQSLLIALLSGGHILLESVPGLAKTTAATTLAQAIDATFHRIQCTPDLLPSDIMGTQLYDQQRSEFKTQLGPVNANFVLLDEINRSSAKTQSAMLEAMQEHQVSIGGENYKLPTPFLVLATQNPIEQEGTYELSEAQMDRFLLKEVITYPTADEEIEVLRRIETGVYTAPLAKSSVTTADIMKLQELANKVYLHDSVKQYIVAIVQATRNPGALIGIEQAKYVRYGASPRGAIGFVQAARARALLDGRDYVTPDDVKAMRHSVLRHRVLLNFEAVADDVHSETIIDAIVNAIRVP